MRFRAALLVLVCGLPPSSGCGCGDDDGASPDGGGFVLVSRTPEPDADNVWVYQPIVLEFSRPVDPASVSDASITLEVAGQPVAHGVRMPEGGSETVELLITEPPPTPAVVTLTISSDLQDDEGTAFAGESWSFTLPVWQHPVAAGPIADGFRPDVVTDLGGAPVVAWGHADGTVSVRRLDDETWADVGSIGVADASAVRLARHPESIVAALGVADGIAVRRWNGAEWESLGTVSSGGSDLVPAFDVAIDDDGNPVVALAIGAGVGLARWNGSEMAGEVGIDTIASVTELALAVDGARAVVAAIGGAGALRTFRQVDGGWEELSGGVDFNSAEQPAVAAAEGEIAVSWQKNDASQLATRHAYAARWSGSNWLRFAHAADLDIQSDATATAVAIDGGQATMAWFEGDVESRKVYAARATTDDASWTFLDSALNADPAADASYPELVLGLHHDPTVVFVEDGTVVLARWNASPTLRSGLAERLPAGDCAIPEEAPPATLAATGCYDDVAGHQLAAELIPFEINSPLWSDGALKRRFILVPDGESIGYAESGALTMPVGTLIVKEFWLERVAKEPASRFPVETRFLVKRCEEGVCLEPWQGYSYRWNEGGTEADLIDPGSGDERTDWTVTNASGDEVDHTHIYPSRLNCTRCHNAASGRVLGLQAIQLDRPARYGRIVASQIDTLAAIGVLSGVGGVRPARLPSSLDPSYDYQNRSRAYYHVNCAQCHRPGGERPTIDFRFEAPLAAGNICNQVTPGNGTGSNLYIKDATRGAGQMPPLATDMPDNYQLATTDAWIDGMSSCP